jgi:site-specific recombinase XerC
MTRQGVCADCGRHIDLEAHDRCVHCYHHARYEAAKRICPTCRQTAILGPQDGICVRCRRSRRPKPLCVVCGQPGPLQGRGRCPRCYHHDATRVPETAARLATDMTRPPLWWNGFADYLADRIHPDRAITLLRLLAPHVGRGPGPVTALEATDHCGRQSHALARALPAYFVHAHLMMPTDPDTPAAALARRATRIAEVPAGFRDVVAAFDAAQLQTRDRARRTGTRPRSDRTLEINLSAVRDLARFLTRHRPAVASWQLVTWADVEAFLARLPNPGNRTRNLQGLQGFFRWARTRRLLLADPTGGLRANSNVAFHGEVLDLVRQRHLLRRWTTHADQLQPNEPLVGLLALLHGASVTELRGMQISDVDHTGTAIRLGRRPVPTPLDPHTASALRRVLTARHTSRDGNPHLLINQKTKTIAGPVSQAYIEKLLAPAGVTPQRLRATRLACLVTTMDPILVARAFGIRHGAVLHYLADTVDPARLAPRTPSNL